MQDPIKIVLPINKKCCKCKQMLRLDNFNKNRTRKDGLTDECKSCTALIRKEHYKNNREVLIEKATIRYHENKEHISSHRKASYVQNLLSWSCIVPVQTKCEICLREILLIDKDKSNVINFDHRHGGTEFIQGSPRNWLNKNKPTEDNMIIWKSCDFGFLCSICNTFLPTQDRLSKLERAIKYARK